MAGDPRTRLLEAAVEHVAGHGLTDLSLRALAAELGTSHRMLIHHFGSKDGLWVAIVQHVEAAQRAAVADLVPQPGGSFREGARGWWQHISDPALWPQERLFFELYGQALRGRGAAVALLDGVVDTWVAPIGALAQAWGLPQEAAEAYARLSVAVVRGLLLDLLATGDRAAVDAAMEEWITLGEARIAAASPGAGS